MKVSHDARFTILEKAKKLHELKCYEKREKRSKKRERVEIKCGKRATVGSFSNSFFQTSLNLKLNLSEEMIYFFLFLLKVYSLIVQ